MSAELGESGTGGMSDPRGAGGPGGPGTPGGPGGAEAVPVSRLAVVGAGFMGSGIAEVAAGSGLEVVLYEPERAALERSRERLERSLKRAVQGGKRGEREAEQLLSRITHTTSLGDLEGAQAAVEAVFEDPHIKGEVFAELDARLPHAVFIASNTSSIPIAELAAHTSRPERVLGLHFFSPVPVMALVEVVAAIDTGEEALRSAHELALRLGKQPIRARDRAGFVVNMLLVPYLMAAVRMYEEGFASAQDIDTGMRLGCGHPMGPLTLCDFIGLDVLAAVCDSLYEEFKRPEYAAPPLLKRMVASGHLGRKSGRGFYVYES